MEKVLVAILESLFEHYLNSDRNPDSLRCRIEFMNYIEDLISKHNLQRSVEGSSSSTEVSS